MKTVFLLPAAAAVLFCALPCGAASGSLVKVLPILENPCEESPSVQGGDLPFPLGECEDPNRPERPRVHSLSVPQVREQWKLQWNGDETARALIWKEGRWLDSAELQMKDGHLVGSSQRMRSFEIHLEAGFMKACFKEHECAVLSVKVQRM